MKKKNCLYNYSLKKHSTFKVGGEAQDAYIPESEEEFIEILENLPSVPVVLGCGSNSIISSNGLGGTVIITDKLNRITSENGFVSAQCGVKMPLASKMQLEKGYAGMEFFIGIPGSVGGAVVMNASAHKQAINDIITRAYVYDMDQNKKLVLSKEELNLQYRSTILTKNKNLILLGADFELQPKNKEDIEAKMQYQLNYRKTHHPSLITPNIGSTFRNPAEGVPVGKLLEDLGAKKWSEGGAKIYENHANFIINYDNATSKDILKLMLKMYNEVKNNYGYNLIPEVKYIGNKDTEEEEIWKILKP